MKIDKKYALANKGSKIDLDLSHLMNEFFSRKESTATFSVKTYNIEIAIKSC